MLKTSNLVCSKESYSITNDYNGYVVTSSQVQKMVKNL